MDRSLSMLLLAILVVLGAIVHQQGKRIEALEAQQAVNLDSIEWVDQRVMAWKPVRMPSQPYSRSGRSSPALHERHFLRGGREFVDWAVAPVRGRTARKPRSRWPRGAPSPAGGNARP